MSSATDGVSHCSSDHEDQADQEHDDADCPKDRYGGDEANGEKDYADDDHGEVTTSEVSGRCKPTLSTHTVEGNRHPNSLSRVLSSVQLSFDSQAGHFLRVSAAKLPAGPDPTISTSKRTLLTELSADGRGSSLHHWDRHKPASAELELLEQISRRAQIDGDGLRGCPDWRGTRLERGCER